MNARLEVSDDLLELEVSEIWKRLLYRDDIGLDEDFFDAAGDSMSAIQLLTELETLTGRPYPEEELANLTIRRMAEVLKREMPEQSSCLTHVRAATMQGGLDSKDVWARLRAVRRMARVLQQRADGCITQAGSGNGIPFFFCHGDFQARGLYAHRLAALLPPDQPVYLLHPQREPSRGTTAEELAHRYLGEVRRVAPGMPVILGGYCNGGYVAWHLAHLLRARGVEVLGVFLVETPSLNARPLVRTVARALRRSPRLQELGTRAVRSLYRHGPRNFTERLYHAVRERLRGPRARRSAASWWTFVRGMSARYAPPPIDVDVYCFLAEYEDRLETEPARWQPLARSVTEIIVPGNHLSAVIGQRQALAGAFADAMADAVERYRLNAERAAPPRSTSRAARVALSG